MRALVRALLALALVLGAVAPTAGDAGAGAALRGGVGASLVLQVDATIEAYEDGTLLRNEMARHEQVVDDEVLLGLLDEQDLEALVDGSGVLDLHMDVTVTYRRQSDPLVMGVIVLLVFVLVVLATSNELHVSSRLLEAEQEEEEEEVDGEEHEAANAASVAPYVKMDGGR
jgi:hypothetical protein